ncbi:MAG: AbrB/MazE/SpoVT family DNA-binding domain-containing protein [Candidatus Aenigmatarchaeota archaeon]
MNLSRLTSIKIDSKGRILIPSEIRKSFGIDPKDSIDIYFSLSKNLIVLKSDQNTGREKDNKFKTIKIGKEIDVSRCLK